MNKLQVKYFKLLQEYSNEVSEATYPYSEKAGQYPETHPFENAPAEILDDEEFMLKCLKLDDECFKFCSYRLRDKKDFVMKALNYAGPEYDQVGDKLKKDFDVLKSLKIKDFSKYGHDILINENKLLQLIKNSNYKDFTNHQWLSIRGISKKKNFFLNLIDNSYNAEFCLKWADNSLKNDFNFISKCISKNARSIKFANKNINKFEKLVLKAIKKDGEILKSLGGQFLNNKKVILLAAQTNGEVFKYINKSLRNDKQIAFKCLLKDPQMLRLADKKFKANKNLIIKLIKKDFSCFKFIDKKLKRDKDILKLLILNLKFGSGSEHKPAASYLVELGDKDLIKFAVKRDGFWLDHLSNKYKNDKEIALLALNNYYGHFSDISERLKEDKQILEFASKKYLKDKKNNINDIESNSMLDRKLYWYIFYKVNPKIKNDKTEEVEGIRIRPQGIFGDFDKLHYFGFMMNGRPHGKGYATNEESEWGDAAFPSTYDGMWDNGRPHGHGEFKQFKANRFPPNGEIDSHYIGPFKNGEKEGKGKEFFYTLADDKTKWRKVEYKKGKLIRYKN